MSNPMIATHMIKESPVDILVNDGDAVGFRGLKFSISIGAMVACCRPHIADVHKRVEKRTAKDRTISSKWCPLSIGMVCKFTSCWLIKYARTGKAIINRNVKYQKGESAN